MTNFYHQEGRNELTRQHGHRKLSRAMDYVSGRLFPQKPNTGNIVIDYGVPTKPNTGIYSPNRGYELIFFDAPRALLASENSRGMPDIRRFLGILGDIGSEKDYINRIAPNATYRADFRFSGTGITASFPGELPDESKELMDEIRDRYGIESRRSESDEKLLKSLLNSIFNGLSI